MMMMMMISLFPNYVFPDLYALSGHEFNINFFLRACRAIKITWHFTASDDFGSMTFEVSHDIFSANLPIFNINTMQKVVYALISGNINNLINSNKLRIMVTLK